MGETRYLKLLALVTSFALVIVPGASAADITRSYLPEAGPVFGSDHLVFAEARSDGGFELNDADAAGRLDDPQVSRAPGGQLLEANLAGGERVVLEQETLHGDGSAAARAFAAPAGSPLLALGDGCRLGGGINQGPLPVGADGSRIAFLGPGCADTGELQATVRDYASDPPRDFALPAGSIAVRVAGQFAAAFGGSLTVYDISTGQAVYSLSPEELTRGSPQISAADLRSFDLRQDGTLAFSVLRSRPSSITTEVGWASPSAPQPHWLALPRRGHYAVRWAGSELLLEAGGYSTGAVPDATLELATLDGQVARVLATGVMDRAMNERFASDGTRVAFVTQGCTTATIHVRLLSDAVENFASPSRCRLVLRRGPRVDALGRLSLRASCAGWRADCRVGRIVVRLAAPRSHIRRGTMLGSGYGGAAGRATVRLNAVARRLFRNGRRVQVRLSARLGEPSFPGGFDVTGAQDRTVTVSLRR